MRCMWTAPCDMRLRASSAHQTFQGRSARGKAPPPQPVAGMHGRASVPERLLSRLRDDRCTLVLAAPATCMLLMCLRLPLPAWHPITLPLPCWPPCGCTRLGGRGGVWCVDLRIVVESAPALRALLRRMRIRY